MSNLDARTQRSGWADYINGGDYDPATAARLVDALLDAQRDQVDRLLPAGCTWSPGTSQIIGPADIVADLDTDEILTTAAEAVAARFDAIEAAAMAPALMAERRAAQAVLDEIMARTQDAVLAARRGGMSQSAATRTFGVDRMTVRKWDREQQSETAEVA